MNKYKKIALLVCGIAGGVALSSLFRGGCNNAAVKKTVTIKQVNDLEEKTIRREKTIQLRIDSINKAAALLTSEILSLNNLLEKAKKQSLQLQTIVTYEALKKPAPGDTLLRTQDCDTLRKTALQFIQATIEKDSLYEAVSNRQEQRITQKDSLVSLHRQQYNALRLSFDESITQQKLLVDQNRSFQKQLRKQRIKNKLLSGLTIIAAGITTSYLLRR
ncbi:MAG: hypothetical protein JNM88_04160 [Chitinophagaceae bacterium]|nr:hypothetical protein [Chitinophagaceae bacterium]